MRNILNKIVDLCTVAFTRRQEVVHTTCDTITDPAEISEFLHIYRKDTSRVNSVCRCLQRLSHPLFKGAKVEKTICQREDAYRYDNPTDSDYAASYYKVFEEIRISKFLPDWDLVGYVVVDSVMWTPGSIAENHEPAIFFTFVGYLESTGDIKGVTVPVNACVEDREYWDHNTLPTPEQILRVPDLLEDEIMEDIEQSFENLKKLKM